MKKLAFSIIAYLLWSSPVYASCQCLCVNGKVEAICTRSNEIKPFCQATICPFLPSSIAPAPTLALPPPGTNSCEMKQVYNTALKKYEWQRICI